MLKEGDEDDGIVTIFEHGQTSNTRILMDEQGNLFPVPTTDKINSVSECVE